VRIEIFKSISANQITKENFKIYDDSAILLEFLQVKV